VFLPKKICIIGANKKMRKNRQKGETLIETLVVTGIFLILIGAILGLFISNTRIQRRILTTQELLDQLSHTLEYMSRTLRMARKDLKGDCLGTAGINYVVLLDESNQPSIIRFLNSEGRCQQFQLKDFEIASKISPDGTQKRLEEEAPLISLTANTSFRVTSQKFNLVGDDSSHQPRVTTFLEAEISGGKKIKLQTSISQRNLNK
jgi:hypothetical protein